MNAQVSFLSGTYTLIHIPLDLYAQLLQPILRTLLPQTQSLNFARDSSEYELPGLASDSQQHGFLNISVTPIECSVVCHASWARNVFEPALAALPADLAARVSVFQDTYMILAVISAGLHPAGRVMELSSPLAFAGIPIFFITTYYSDFILVPTKERDKVSAALLAKGFELSDSEDDDNNNNTSFNPSAAAVRHHQHQQHQHHQHHQHHLHQHHFHHHHHHHHHQMDPVSDPAPPLPDASPPDHDDDDDDNNNNDVTASSSSKAPPSSSHPLPLLPDYDELQARTFELLHKRSVVPRVEPGLELVQCSGRETSPIQQAYNAHRSSMSRKGSTDHRYRRTWIDHVDAKLYTCIVSALVSQPRFMSLTLAQDDPPSLLLDRQLLPLFGDTLVGDTDAVLVPIMLDLVNLPFESTGIVCGVAGRLVKDDHLSEGSELSYLSTARAGAVVLSQEQAAWALEILEPLLNKSP